MLTEKNSHSATIDLVNKTLAKRHRAEKRFRAYGIAAILFGLSCVTLLFVDIISKGASAFMQTRIQLEIHFDPDYLAITDINDLDQVASADYQGLINLSLSQVFPQVTNSEHKKQLFKLVSSGAGYNLRQKLEQKPELLGRTLPVWLLADDDLDLHAKGHDLDENGYYSGRLTELQLAWFDWLVDAQRLEKQFNHSFFTNGDSREPEQAGILGAIMGSLLALVITMVLSFPIGIAAAVYLEEYADKNRFTDFIEVNINNLAAVPSIIFGLLGLALFIGLFGMHRSLPLVGGLVLTLMTLPTIIISSRAAIKAIPQSIRDGAYALGASKMQVVMHHILPLAMPGMLTGAIIGFAQALGETAPLLMIGMVAFIVDIPGGVSDPSTALPVQIFLWSDSPERAFVERTSAAIMVLLAFLISMNTFAVWLRKRLERRW